MKRKFFSIVLASLFCLIGCKPKQTISETLDAATIVLDNATPYMGQYSAYGLAVADAFNFVATELQSSDSLATQISKDLIQLTSDALKTPDLTIASTKVQSIIKGVAISVQSVIAFLQQAQPIVANTIWNSPSNSSEYKQKLSSSDKIHLADVSTRVKHIHSVLDK